MIQVRGAAAAGVFSSGISGGADATFVFGVMNRHDVIGRVDAIPEDVGVEIERRPPLLNRLADGGDSHLQLHDRRGGYNARQLRGEYDRARVISRILRHRLVQRRRPPARFLNQQ